MVIRTQALRYEVAGKAYESLATWDDATSAPRPAVLVAPSFFGRSAFEEAKAEKLAARGYAGVAIDIFGVETRPASIDEAVAAMSMLDGDRKALAATMQAGLDQTRALAGVDAGRIAAIGFCFGGKCVLDLARSGAEVKGVAAFHGIFDAPPFETAPVIAAKVLALHGWDDPLADPDAVIAFAAEMTAKKADWQLHAYGHTEHAFTNPGRPESYRPDADRRSWQALENFLGELFG